MGNKYSTMNVLSGILEGGHGKGGSRELETSGGKGENFSKGSEWSHEDPVPCQSVEV